MMSKGQREILTLEEIKREELGLLLKFKEFCDRYDLRFYLAGGTLLGAVRHGGFIPWDDDIDVCMPRPDWDKLVSLSDSLETEFDVVLRPYPGATLGCTPFVKVCSKDIFVQAEKEQEESALWVDVFPVDGLPEDRAVVEREYEKANTIRSFIMIASSTAKSGRNSLRRAIKRVIGPVLRFPAVRKLLYKRLESIARSVFYGSTNTVGAVTWGLYGTGEAMPLKSFEKRESVKFEGHDMPCMSCWREYLTGIYGDYMQLPPEEKRVTHGLKAWRVKGGAR